MYGAHFRFYSIRPTVVLYIQLGVDKQLQYRKPVECCRVTSRGFIFSYWPSIPERYNVRLMHILNIILCSRAP